MEYMKTLQRLEEQGATLPPGSDQEQQAIERFEALLGDFKAPDFGPRVRQVYATGAFFNDTLKTVRGAADIEAYLVHSGEAIHQGTVEFLDLTSNNGNYYFRWLMTLRFKRLASGKPKQSIGMSHIRFDDQGKVVLHQDFWDSAAGLFEHVPVLGWTLKRAKKQL